MTEESIPPVRLFISYSHEDDGMRKDLDPFLKPLINEKLITVWYDREILAAPNGRRTSRTGCNLPTSSCC